MSHPLPPHAPTHITYAGACGCGSCGLNRTEVKCPLCQKMCPSLEMRQHMGSHILHNPSLFTTSNPCGFCGAEAGLCRSWLETSASTVKPRTKCQLLGGVAGEGALKYNHASAKKMSGTAPCTNHLVECEFCAPEQNQQRPVFWSYNLSHHHNCMHSSHAKPPEAVVGELERELVKTVGSGKGLTKDQKKKLSSYLAAAKVAAVLP